MSEEKITFDKVIRWATVAAISVAVFAITDYLSSALLPFFIAWLLAYLLYPMVKFIQYRMHIKIRAIAIIIAMLAIMSVIGLLIYFIVPPMVSQFQKLYEFILHWLHQTTHTNDFSRMVKDWAVQNQEAIERFFRSKDFSDTLKTAMPKVFSVIGQTANIVMSIIASCITLLYTFFILLDCTYPQWC